MRLILTFKSPHHKTKVIEIVCDRVNLSEMKKLWEVEQTINSLPATNTRLHVDLREN